jgi:hypothetical protein
MAKKKYCPSSLMLLNTKMRRCGDAEKAIPCYSLLLLAWDVSREKLISKDGPCETKHVDRAIHPRAKHPLSGGWQSIGLVCYIGYVSYNPANPRVQRLISTTAESGCNIKLHLHNYVQLLSSLLRFRLVPVFRRPQESGGINSPARSPSSSLSE